ALLIIVVLSYQQTIHAYPTGGGSYIVSTSNLGRYPGFAAASALMIDYVMTVAVSVASGVAAVTSAFPALYSYRVIISVVVIALVALANLRGLREAGRAFAIPTYLFVVMAGGLVIVGIIRYATGHLAAAPVPDIAGQQLQGFAFVYLIFHAFASGCTAMTGTEAISDGVPAFKPPESRNAAMTLGVMAVILGSLLIGITYLAQAVNVVSVPNDTVLSQIGRAVYGDGGFFYYLLQVATMGILFLAANTSFADFPRLSFFLARDGLMPRQLMNRGDKLAFSNGIVGLAVISMIVVAIFNASVTKLIPLYAVGVFVSFTLSQAGMVAYWTRKKVAGWKRRAYMNGFGAVATGIVAIMQLTTKFLEGAYLVVIAGVILVSVFYGINSHYRKVARFLEPQSGDRLERLGRIAKSRPHTTVVLFVSQVNEITARSLSLGKALSADDFHAATVASNPEALARLQHTWEEMEIDIPLKVIESPYREFIRPAVDYVHSLNPSRRHTVTVVIPEFVVEHWWENVLHNQNALRLKAALLGVPWVVVISIPFHIGVPDGDEEALEPPPS
ncbi:MAG TPA: APC family permease, partial [Thermoleophilia bacterium]|nr:APC family permease [Thermoleophilia bacterium]